MEIINWLLNKTTQNFETYRGMVEVLRSMVLMLKVVWHLMSVVVWHAVEVVTLGVIARLLVFWFLVGLLLLRLRFRKLGLRGLIVVNVTRRVMRFAWVLDMRTIWVANFRLLRFCLLGEIKRI